MNENKPQFLETSVARFIRARLKLTFEENSICIISGAWGIGKTTAAISFAHEHSKQCIIVKVEAGSGKRGTSPIFVMQQTLERVREQIGRPAKATLSSAYWSLRQMMYNYLNEWRDRLTENGICPQRFAIIYDEAQYLSREAIEMLRYWNDADNGFTPFPVCLIFLGNNEFALDEQVEGGGILSGAVRSRAMFIETLDYDDVMDDDISAFLDALGAYDDLAKEQVIAYFNQPRVRRDFRSIGRFDQAMRRKCGQGPISLATAKSVLG